MITDADDLASETDAPDLDIAAPQGPLKPSVAEPKRAAYPQPEDWLASDTGVPCIEARIGNGLRHTSEELIELLVEELVPERFSDARGPDAYRMRQS